MSVYAIEGGGMIKIGYTAGDPVKRMREIQNMSGSRLSLVAVWPGDRETERRLHGIFAEYRSHGEWFAMPPGWRSIIDLELGYGEPGPDALSQEALAERLLDELQLSGECDGIDVGVVLDSLACAGIALVLDPSGESSSAYFLHCGVAE